jgi:hypothetical protein
VVGKRQLLGLVQRAAVDIDAFNAGLTPMPRTADELLIVSADLKGVVMRPEALRPATAKAATHHTRTFRTRPTTGEKPARKRMAILGAVYDATPAAPHDVIRSRSHTATTRRQMTSNELTPSWRRSHAGFDAARYRVRLVEVGLTGEDQAIARFDAHITLVPSEARQGQPVEIPGRYTIGLRRSTGHWTIHSIRHDQT